MIASIHQPEHFPYMGFFQKMSSADVFVILDNVQYKKRNFQNRNKIKLKSGEDYWLTVPVDKDSDRKVIKDVTVSKDTLWRKKLIRTVLEHLKFDISEFYEHEKLIDINMSSIKWCMKKLSINTPLVYASDLSNLSGSKSELLASILREIGANKYISGPSGKDYLDLSYFEGIEVEFFEPKVKNYYSCIYNILRQDC